MRFPVCIRRIGPVLVLALLVTGCTKGGQFDPTEFFSGDMFDTKKRLQGERKPVFPAGVPGAETGVPPDLVKGYQPPPEPAVQTDAAAAAAAAAEPEPKPKPKPVKKKVVAAPPPSSAPTQIDIRPAPPQAAQPAPPQPAQAQSGQPGSVWPDPPKRQPQNVWPDTPPVQR